MSLRVHNLRSPKGAKSSRKRLGRGPGSGHGKTAGKGHKGQLARQGKGKPRLGFEGGQTPLTRRIPKFGFTNIHRKSFQVVSLKRLAELKLFEGITPELLKKSGIVKHLRDPIKVLNVAGWKCDSKLNLQLHAISQSARKSLEEAGGSFQEHK